MNVGEEMAEEVWTYAGVREHKGKRYHAWLDGSGSGELPFSKLAAYVIGGNYKVNVTRGANGSISVSRNVQYVKVDVSPDVRAEMEALDAAAKATLARVSRERSAARQSALDDALLPLAVIAGKLRTGPERDAFLAYVIRRVSQGW